MSAAPCPKCEATELVEMRTSDHITLDFCDACGGMWFDANELADFLGLTVDFVQMDKVRDSAKPTALACPKCPGELVEMPFAAESELLVDWCPACRGTFFDFREAGEAQALAATLESSQARLKVIQQRFFQKGFGG
ncbi:MAG: zf-TFIIB domain-containing protein [Pseudomonadota bacterium]